ncbi:hypothetical protein AFM16_31420 [Streptomyces antibioticus]|uniref:Uncharacterized protein n=1 Tax=Streptomyces antibioticus TaxID=1890 RepID=A0ABX3L9Z9_STRAT|nr:hypothetical protein AFM16_31420 [Streptomyces antibioticus]
MVMLGGLGLTAHGVWREQATLSLAGVVLCMVALSLTVLAVVYHWVTDTSTERIALAAAQRQAQQERATHIAAKAQLENERARLYQDLAADRAADAQRLKAERASVEAEFEDARAKLVADSMEILASWFVNGKIQPPEGCTGNLIHFPKQTEERDREQAPMPRQQPDRPRAREHGVVGP